MNIAGLSPYIETSNDSGHRSNRSRMKLALCLGRHSLRVLGALQLMHFAAGSRAALDRRNRGGRAGAIKGDAEHKLHRDSFASRRPSTPSSRDFVPFFLAAPAKFETEIKLCNPQH